MSTAWRRWWFWIRSAFVVFLGLDARGVSEPDATAILKALADRARTVARETNAPMCVYRNVSTMDTLDASGAVRRSKEKVYEVTLRQGMTHNRLVQVDGRPLTAEESAVQSEKEKRWRDTYAGGKGGSMMERMDQLVNDGLIARFEFTLSGRERVRNVECWILDFRPRSGELPVDRLMDRVINLLHGRVWISVADDEIVRADVRTEGTLKLWGGFLGSLESFRLHLDRDPSPFGPWYNRHAEVVVRARKLFSQVHVRLRELGGDVRLVSPTPP